MDFEKKLVILSGKTGRGTALIERNGMGTFITLNVFALPDISAGEYALGVKTGERVFRREVGSLGKIKSRFSLPSGDYSSVHLVVFRTYDEEVVLYGTSEARRMWEGNLMDGLRRKGLEKKTADIGEIAATPQDFSYSERKIEDYFLDIDPSAYYDGALAEVNYFDYSPRESTPGESEKYYTETLSPSEMTRRYLSARFGGGKSDSGVAVQSSGESDSGGDDEREIAAFAAAGLARDDSVAPTAKPDSGREQKIKSASQYTVEQAVAAVKTGAGFYASVKSQLDKLFEGGEKFEPLQSALPGTRWVKVDYDDGGRYYVVGLIGSAPDYIAYGVPGKYGDTPAALEGADFIPLIAAEPTGDGFWVLFQSAETGKEIVRKP